MAHCFPIIPRLITTTIRRSQHYIIGSTNQAKPPAANDEKEVQVVSSSCGDIDSSDHDNDDDDFDDDGMEQEEMFVEAHSSFGHNKVEWGGPRRGGRLPEPTRFGDWERKGRCSDF